MNEEDRRLEAVLRSMGEIEIYKPANLRERILQRLHASPRSKVPRGRSLLNNLALTAAVSIMLVAGICATWRAIDWWSSSMNPNDGGKDLALDPRIVEAREVLPFAPALPAWVPEGYRLESVHASVVSEADARFELTFAAARNQPITVAQSFALDLTIAQGDLRIVQFDAGYDYYWLGSNDTGWGEGTRSDRGIFYEQRRNGQVLKRGLVFISGRSEVTFVHISSSRRSATQWEVAGAEDILALARAITGYNAQLLTPEESAAVKNWPLIRPAYLPPQDYQLAAIQLQASSTGRGFSGIQSYSSPQAGDITVRQAVSQQPLTIARGSEEITLSAAYLPLTAYYFAEDNKIVFSVEGDWLYNFEVSGQPGVSKEELVKVAQSIAGQYSRMHLPILEVNKFNVLPTTSGLSFGPGENAFVGYVPANGMIAKLWVDGKEHDLPGVELLPDYGPVWWRGERFVYHVLCCFPYEDPGLFYVYDIRDHSYVRIEARDDWDANIKQAVFLDDETIAVLAPGGIWTYDLGGKSWRLHHAVSNYPDIKAVAWSPDAAKVAWITQDKVTVFDLTTATELVILEADDEELLAVAWSSDSRLLAVAGREAGWVWDGSQLAPLELSSFGSDLSWAPGKDIVCYRENSWQQNLVLVGKRDGQWNNVARITADFIGYSWTPNGNLAVIRSKGEKWDEVIVYGWK